MCGIVGVIGKSNISNDVIEQMTDQIVHRGPDGGGSYSGNNFAFGHRRLAIVDLSEAGKQPMTYLNERYAITFNGEIYNFIELKSELENKGYSFNTDTDTEVIMASYDFWGVDCLKRFNGMWAFVLYDSLEDNFFISRDRFGKKPLYYYCNDEVFVFASEIKSLLACSDVRTDVDNVYIDEYIKNGPSDYKKETPFKNIYRFSFSNYSLCGREKLIQGKLEQKIFWSIPKTNHHRGNFCNKKAEEYATKYYELLKDSVRIRLRSDVKVGSALSGGLDSSSIVYLVNQILREEGKTDLQETFSSVYKHEKTKDCDESEFIDLLAEKLNVKSNQIEPREEDIPSEHPQMIAMMETPPESTCMSGWHTFKKVQESDVTVTLDGQGADEQLGGYLSYLINYFSSMPIKSIFSEFKQFKQIPSAKSFMIKGIAMNFTSRIISRKLASKLYYKKYKKEFMFDVNEKLKEDTVTSLIQLIHYSDHVSMAHSIESRMPFMDYRLVEFLATIPAEYKLHNGWTKYIARLAFDNKLPDEITWRKDKMGWPIPENYWFRGGLKKWFLKTIKASDYFGEKDFININDKLNSNIHIKGLVRYLNVSIWYKKFK